MSVAREVVEVIKCDIDQRPDAQGWVIAPNGESLKEIDICDECRRTRPLEEIYAKARPITRRKRKTGGTSPTHRIEPID